MNITRRNSIDYTEQEFENIVCPVIEASIEKLKTTNSEEGVIQLWLNSSVGLNIHRVNDQHLEILKAALYEAGWNNEVKWREDERTGAMDLYVALFL